MAASPKEGGSSRCLGLQLSPSHRLCPTYLFFRFRACGFDRDLPTFFCILASRAPECMAPRMLGLGLIKGNYDTLSLPPIPPGLRPGGPANKLPSLCLPLLHLEEGGEGGSTFLVPIIFLSALSVRIPCFRMSGKCRQLDFARKPEGLPLYRAKFANIWFAIGQI